MTSYIDLEQKEDMSDKAEIERLKSQVKALRTLILDQLDMIPEQFSPSYEGWDGVLRLDPEMGTCFDDNKHVPGRECCCWDRSCMLTLEQLEILQSEIS